MDIRVPIPSILQHHTQSDETLWARIVSLIFNPPLIWAVWIYPITLEVSPSRNEALLHATIFAIFVCWIPILFVTSMVKLGKIGDLHMRESNERYIPYAISIIGGVIAGIILNSLQAHPILLILTLVTCVQLTLMLVGTFFDHISTHAMAVTSVTSATALVFGLNMGLAIIPFALLVILARLVLNRHTNFQIMVGTLIGGLTPYLVIFVLSLVIR
jgi:membrane-associated phospholipid phosphatase